MTPIYPPDDPGDEPGTGEVPTDPLVTSEEIPTVENPTEEVTTSGDQTETSVLEKPNDGCASVISASILLPLLAIMLILPALSEKRKNTDDKV